MINKTFNSDSTDCRALEVGRNGERPWLNIREFDLENTMFMLAPSDAPALALAILEAAGVEPVNHSVTGLGKPNWLEGIAHSLKLHIEHGAKATAEAEAQAKLEAEALELCNAAIRQEDGAIYDSFSQIPTPDLWIAVARRAREMKAEK